MPIYEYKCSNCGHVVEKIQKINSKPYTLCTECNKRALERQISLSSFILKGDGWYETDFK